MGKWASVNIHTGVLHSTMDTLQYVTLGTTLNHGHTPVCYTGYYTQPQEHSSMLHWVLHSTTGHSSMLHWVLHSTKGHSSMLHWILHSTTGTLQYVILGTTLNHGHTPVCYTGYYTQPQEHSTMLWYYTPPEAHSSMLHWVLHSTTGTLQYVMVLHSTTGTLQYVTLGTTLHHGHTAVCYTGYYTPPWAHCSMLHWVLNSTNTPPHSSMLH